MTKYQPEFDKGSPDTLKTILKVVICSELVFEGC